jgi:hypothetical protein
MKQIEDAASAKLDQKATAVYAKFVDGWKEKVR